MKAYLFPGQGSQAKGMGKPLFERHPDRVATADRVLGYSIAELCLDDPRQELNRTRFTQPAIFVVNALALQDRLQQGERPDVVAGHSLGEFDALLAAGCFDFETGLRLVQKRAELMGQAAEGAMAAVLGMAPADIVRVLQDNGFDQIDVANFNTPSQTVISGSKAQIAGAQVPFQQAGAQYIPLNTSGAFHSRLMAPAQREFAAFLSTFRFEAPKIPVIANLTAKPYGAADVAANLAGQITGSVRWVETVHHIQAEALAAGATAEFVEVGHGDVLTKMLQKIRAAGGPPAVAPHKAAATVSPPPPALTPASPQDKVHQWNQRHPIGTRVRSRVLADAVVETRTQAVLLFQHRAAVYLEGYHGYFDLDELAPA